MSRPHFASPYDLEREEEGRSSRTSRVATRGRLERSHLEVAGATIQVPLTLSAGLRSIFFSYGYNTHLWLLRSLPTRQTSFITRRNRSASARLHRQDVAAEQAQLALEARRAAALKPLRSCQSNLSLRIGRLNPRALRNTAISSTRLGVPVLISTGVIGDCASRLAAGVPAGLHPTGHHPPPPSATSNSNIVVTVKWRWLVDESSVASWRSGLASVRSPGSCLANRVRQVPQKSAALSVQSVEWDIVLAGTWVSRCLKVRQR